MVLHIVKLSVGCDSVETLRAWQASRCVERPSLGRVVTHITRQTPRRAGVGQGSSMYWVMGGLIRCRQLIKGFDEIQGDDGVTRCAIVLGAEIYPTQPSPRRPFQGWRYLDNGDAPRDLAVDEAVLDMPMPPAMRAALSELRLI